MGGLTDVDAARLRLFGEFSEFTVSNPILWARWSPKIYRVVTIGFPRAYYGRPDQVAVEGSVDGE
jgi:hypothetical protein